MRSKILPILFIAAIALVAVIFGWAGSRLSDNGNLHILVLGADNSPLDGAKVISNTQPNGQLKVTGSTQTDGTVSYSNIKPGDYEFYVSRFDYDQKGFSVTVLAGRTTDFTISLVRTPAEPG